LLFGGKEVTLEEIQFQSTRTRPEAIHSPTEVESKDMLKHERMKAIENLHTYQAETKASRDKKLKNH
jgi:hypothetical protein